MKRYFFYALFLISSLVSFAQTSQWQDIYKVKKKDTLYGISKKYNITVDDLIKANPLLTTSGYKLEKGDKLLIPFPKKLETKEENEQKAVVKDHTVRVGVMLPLHDVDGDGRRMVEYYRGMLMACDSMRVKGISTDIHAWNVSVDANIESFLQNSELAKCDVIFGPLYTKQVGALGRFCKKNDINMVIPFSISGNDVATNNKIIQIYQSPQSLNEKSIKAFLERFGNVHPVFIDCNDTTSKKGVFTFELRKRLESRGIEYSITNLKSSESYFSKAFSRTKPNVVILNTGRSPELNVALAKLDGLVAINPELKISLFGYTEWFMYTKVYLNYFHKYETYIPATYFYNPLARQTVQLESAYRKWFKTEMQGAYPRFAIVGYDHARFFIEGIHRYGKSFMTKSTPDFYKPLQTPLKLVRNSENSGLTNNCFMLVHYKNNHEIESISY